MARPAYRARTYAGQPIGYCVMRLDAAGRAATVVAAGLSWRAAVRTLARLDPPRKGCPYTHVMRLMARMSPRKDAAAPATTTTRHRP